MNTNTNKGNSASQCAQNIGMETGSNHKTCARCNRTLPIAAFRLTRWGTFASTCNNCMNKAKEERRARNKAAHEEQMRTMRLQDFSPRELMEELARRGYDGTLTFTETHSINISKINEQ